jgi:hypothetical protein
MKKLTFYCDICSNQIEKNKHFQIDVRWINGNQHYLDLCENCKDDIGYKFNRENTTFFSEVLKRFKK